MEVLSKEKIVEPIIKKITAGYRQQASAYEELLHLSEKQHSLVSAKEIYKLAELHQQKTEILEKIAEEEGGLKKLQDDMVRALNLESFSISELKKELSNPSVDELYKTLVDLGHIVKRAEQAEAENEENLKKILHKK